MEAQHITVEGKLSITFIPAHKVDTENNEEDFLNSGMEIAPGVIYGESHYKAVFITEQGRFHSFGKTRHEATAGVIALAI